MGSVQRVQLTPERPLGSEKIEERKQSLQRACLLRHEKGFEKLEWLESTEGAIRTNLVYEDEENVEDEEDSGSMSEAA